nr:glycerol-3-phosphate dehydrogenase/oxidase [Alteribacillus persepolensis]
MHYFSSQQRHHITKQLTSGVFDVLVIGGGITGCGIALDAASRGMKTALVDMQDFAAGTSSRSTKLVHGGLRYLKQGEVKLVAEVGKERAVVYENAPHVTKPEWMLLPLYKNGTFGRWSTSLGLRLYDYLAGVKHTERRQMLSVEETLRKAPLLKREGLIGSGYYVEYKTDDARLTIETAKAAARHGAALLNYAQAVDFLYKDNKAIGAAVTDKLSGQTHRVFARCIVNAAGPWVDRVRRKDVSAPDKSLLLTKGIHLVFDQSVFPLKQAVYFDSFDDRMIFAIPRDGKTYVGTTDTTYHGDIANPRMSEADRAYLLDAVHYMFPKLNVSQEHVESGWAGLRPLIHEEGKSPSDISRKDEIWIHDSGVMTIAGGKLTGYRSMAEAVVDKIAALFEKEYRIKCQPCQTKHIPLSGGDIGGSLKYDEFVRNKCHEGKKRGLSQNEAERLAKTYGANVDILFDYAERSVSPLLPPSLYAEVRYAVDHEMAAALTDFFVRRTAALYFNIHWVKQWKDGVEHTMGELLHWDKQERAKQRERLEKAVHDALTPVRKEV